MESCVFLSISAQPDKDCAGPLADIGHQVEKSRKYVRPVRVQRLASRGRYTDGWGFHVRVLPD